MPLKPANEKLIRAILCTLGLMVFSFFIPFAIPLKLVAFLALIAVAFLIAGNTKSWDDFRKITGVTDFSRVLLMYLAVGVLFGIVLAVIYRWHLNAPFFPGTLTGFAAVAAMIGSSEELIFRGYIQGLAKQANGLFSIFLGTFSHTAYKCCLFLSPSSASETDIVYLALLTFGAGIVMGLLRHFSKSAWPALIAHAIFDILVYGENINSPWWVW